MNRIVAIIHNKRLICKCFAIFTTVCALLSVMLSGYNNDLKLTLNTRTTSQVSLSYGQRTAILTDKTVSRLNNSKMPAENTELSVNQSAQLADILKNNQNASLFFDKNGKFMKAVIYDTEGKTVSFAVMDQNNKIKYYKNTASLRRFALRRDSMPSVLGDMLQNPEGNDESRTVSTASTWAALKTMVNNGGVIEITADLVANREIKITKDIILYSQNDSIKSITRANELRLYPIFTVKENSEKSPDFILRNVNLGGNGIQASAPAIYAENGTNLTLENVSVADFISLSGKSSSKSHPGVISFFGKKLNVKNSEFLRCVSTEGGAIYSALNSTLNIYSSAFEHNKTTYGHGGAVYSAGVCNINAVENGQTTFIKNSSCTQGGAVWASGKLTLSADSGSKIVISENTAIFGGAVYAASVSGNGTGSILLSKNNAQKYGGAVFAQKVASDGCKDFSINENTAGINGGGIYFSTAGGTSFSVSGINMNGNSAERYGGAVYIPSGTVNVGNCTFNDNNAHVGGALYIDGAVTLDDNAEFQNNHARVNGGAVYCSELNSGAQFTFIGNSSEGKGGAIFCEKEITLAADSDILTSTAVFDGNNACDGGAIFVLGDTTIKHTISGNGIGFKNNSALNNGGALYFEKGIATVSDGLYTGNTAKNNGGAVYSNVGEITVEKGLFQKNSAQNGGALASKAAITNILNNARFTNNNYASRFGGAIYISRDDELSPRVRISDAVLSGISENADDDNDYSKVSGNLLYTNKCDIEIKNSILSNGKANIGGAAYFSDSTVVLDGDRFEKNTSSYQGGALYVYGGSLKVKNTKTVFNNNTADSNGGAIYIKSATANICSAEFSENESGFGGAVYAAANTTLDISKTVINDTSSEYSVKFTNNSAKSNGGAVYMAKGSINVYNAEFVSNSANNGGAIYAYNLSVASDKDVVFSGNRASLSGGAVYVFGSSVFNIKKLGGDIVFKDNTASNGGAIYSVASANISSGLFKNNTATFNGGAVYGKNNISLGDGKSYDNLVFTANSSGNNGGSIYSAKNVYLEYVILSENKASNGGAIYSTKAVVANAGILINNSSVSDGGAVYSCDNVTVGNNDSKKAVYILNNNAKQNGGGIFSRGKAMLNNGYISANVAANGGGVYTCDNVVFGECVVGSALEKPEVYLAALFSNTDNYGILNSVNVIKNTDEYEQPSDNITDDINRLIKIGNCALNGGGIFVSANSVNIDIKKDSSSETDISDTYVRGNLAQYGGGLFLKASLDCNNSADITENIALSSGGAIAIAGEASKDVILKNVSPYKNYAENGSLIYTNLISENGNDTVTAILSGCVLSDCNPNNGIYTKKGAAVYAENNVLFEDCKITNNKSENGGAVYSTGNSCLSNTVINNNTASANGGAVYSENNTSFENCIISKNTAEYGGVIFSLNKCSFVNSSVSDNTAAVNGGAVYGKFVTVSDDTEFSANSALQGGAVYAENNVSVSDSRFIGNKAIKGCGGAVLQINGHMDLKNSTFTSNTASKDGGAVSVSSGSGVSEYSDTVFESNTAAANGGAVFIATRDDVNITSSKFISDTANNGAGIYIDSVDHFFAGGTSKLRTQFNDCRAKNNGGAMFLNNINGSGKLELDSNVYIKANDAKNNGAGIYINSTGSGNTVISATFAENIASNGNGGAVFVGNKASASFENADIGNNYARKAGGGLFVSENGSAILKNSNVIYNNAEKAGGIFVSKAASLALDGCSVNDNTALDGAAVYSEGTLTLSGDSVNKISDNIADGKGGGIYTSSDILLDNVILSGNKSVYGAGVFADGNVTVTLGNATVGTDKSISDLFTVPKFNEVDSNIGENKFDNATIKAVRELGGNVADFGGGMFLNGAAIEFLNNTNSTTQISSNLAVYGGGGICSAALSNDVKRDLYVSSNYAALKVSGNAACFGGGLYTDADSCTLGNKLTMSGNMAVSVNDIGGDGAAVYFGNIEDLQNTECYAQFVKNENSEQQYSVVGSSYIDNAASDNGGAIYVANGKFSFENGYMVLNHAQNNGGAVYLHSGEASFVSGSIGNGNVVDGNSAKNGGGLYIENSDNCVLGQIGDDKISVTGNSAKNGGGIYALSGTTNFTEGLTVSYNTAESGGGIMSPNDTAEYNGVKIIGNKASSQGGGLFLGSDNFYFKNTDAAYFIVDATISQNSAYDGGGVFVRSGYYYLDAGVEISYNTAVRNGAGICFSVYARDMNDGLYKDWDDVSMDLSATVSNNTRANGATADSYGGGIYVNKNDYLAIYGADIKGNSLGRAIENNNCHTYGGAVYAAEGSTVEIYGASVGCNISDINQLNYYNIKKEGGNIADFGGAIYLADAKLVISDADKAKISGNYSYINGGAIAMYSSGAELTDESGAPVLDDNGYVARAHSEVTINGTDDFKQELNYNMTEGIGGAIYVADNGDCSLVDITNAELSGNIATYYLKDGNGGAVYIGGGKINISNSEFSANRAYNNGGSLYVTGGTVNISSTLFKNARASADGAAVYAVREGGGNCVINIADSEFTNNRSTGNGGAVSASYGIVLSIDNSNFANNSAKLGSSLYLYNLISKVKLIGCSFGEASSSENQIYAKQSETELANAVINGGADKTNAAIMTTDNIYIDGTINVEGSVYLCGNANYIKVDENILENESLVMVKPIDLIVLEGRGVGKFGETIFDITDIGNYDTASPSEFCVLNNNFNQGTLANNNGKIILIP